MNTRNTQLSPTQSIEGIEIFEGENISSSGYTNIILGLDGKGKYSQREQAIYGEYTVSECGSIFLVESSSYQEIEAIKNFWQVRFKARNSLSSELQDGREIPKYSGYFQKDGKYYLLGALCYSPNKRNLTEKNGCYNGILWRGINPEISDRFQTQVVAGAEVARQIIDGD